MIRSKIAVVILTCIMMFLGCSSKVVRKELVNVHKPGNQTPADTVQLKLPDTKINKIAFHYFSNAAIYESAGLLYQAAEYYRKALEYYPDSYEIRFSLARVLYRERHFDDALMALVPIEPEDNSIWTLRGTIYRGLGKKDSAHFCFRQAVKADSNDVTGYSNLINSYHVLGFPDSVAWVYKNLARLKPDNEHIWHELGELQWDLDKSIDAKESFRKSIEINSDSTNMVAIVRFGDLYAEQHKLDSALFWYQRAIELAPADYRLWSKQGAVYRLLDKIEEAKRSYHKSAELCDDFSNNLTCILTRFILVELYNEEDSLKKGLAIAKEAFKVTPRNSEAHRLLSNQYMHLEQLDSALVYAISEVALDLTDMEATRRLAVLYFYNDSLTIADSVFTSLVNNGDTSSINHHFLGRIAMVKENSKRAAMEFEKVVKIDDTDSENWLNLGYAYWKLEKENLEINAYLSGIEHVTDEEGEVSLMFALATAYERYNQFDNAVETFEDLLKRDPDNHQTLNYLGYSLADRGKRLQYARSLIEKAVNLNPNNAAYLDSFGWVYYQLKDYKNALIYLKRAVVLDSDQTIFDHLGDVYQAKGDSVAARQWWKKALELDSGNESIKSKLDQ